MVSSELRGAGCGLGASEGAACGGGEHAALRTAREELQLHRVRRRGRGVGRSRR